jgi:hypothetical protein
MGTPVAAAVERPTGGAAAAARRPLMIAASTRLAVTGRGQPHPMRHPERPTPAAAVIPLHRGCPASAAKGSRHGEGVLALTLAAPGTSWSSPTDTAVTVDVRVDHGPTQQIVLFDGAQPFRYDAFVGTTTTGRHCLTVSINRSLSRDTTAPTVAIYAAHLGVVPRHSPGYLLITHAPVLYGRSSSAERNAQLLTYGQASRDGRRVDLSYTVIWTREDVGDGVVPAYEWGLWGRMTDIETVLKETVTRHGTVTSASYLSCGCEQVPAYLDEAPAPPVDSEEDTAYPSSGTPPKLGHHLVLRDATGNNDMSPHGTSNYRMQQVPVAGPAASQSREVAMDEHPWTYRLSNDEITRTTAQSTSPDSLLAGNYPQYLIADIDTAATGTSSIAVEVQLAGDPTWYSNDYEQVTEPGPPTTYPFYNGGHARTVIKLPPDWNGARIAAVRLRLDAPAGGPAPKLTKPPNLSFVEVTPRYAAHRLPAPAPSVVTGTQLLPGLPS